MFVHKYLAAKRPKYIVDGGYFYDINEYVIGFSQSNDGNTCISTEDAAAHICSLAIKNAGEEFMTMAQKYATALDFLDSYDIETTELSMVSVVNAAKTIIFNRFRVVRTYLVYASDYTVNNSNLEEEEQAAWSNYRGTLFNIPQDEDDIEYYEQISYPMPPDDAFYDKIKVLYPHYKQNKDAATLIGV